MSERLRVDEPTPLLRFLEAHLGGWSRKAVKERLRLGCVQVNGVATTKHDHPLGPGDEVLVRAKGDAAAPRVAPAGFTTLHEDDDLIAIDKPAGLLSVATDKEADRTALAMVRDSMTGPRARQRVKLWPVHRLDRETSGVLLLARSREMCKALQRSWSSADKEYLAVVSGHPSPPEGAIDQPLWEDPSLNVRVGGGPGSRDARTRFRTRITGPERALLEVRTDTGRRHQIRVHLAHIGHPIVGDKRYGRPGTGSRLGLHALRLEVTDPRTGERLGIEAPPDAKLLALVRRES